MSFCAKCGAQLAPDARFCAKCGTPAPEPAPVETAEPAVAPPPPVIPPPIAPAPAATIPPASSYRGTADRPVPDHIQPAKRSTWWIVPAVIVGLVLIAWLLLARLPFGRDERTRVAENPATTDTIAEGTSTARNEPITGTVIEVPGIDQPPATTETTPPPLDTGAAPTTTVAPPVQREEPRVIEEPVRTATQPPPPVRTTPPPVRTPPPAPPPATRPAPAPAPPPVPARTGEISDAEGAATLRSYINSNSYYEGVSGDCVQVRSQGYSNVGYTYSVWDGCVSGGGTRMLGRWRVDSKTREVFRQQGGRFLRP